MDFYDATVIIDGKSFVVPSRIQKAFMIDSTVIVLFQLEKQKGIVDNNISAYDFFGNKVWSVEDPKKKYGLDYDLNEMDKKLKGIYVDIKQSSDGLIEGSTFFSVVYSIDRSTGKIINRVNNRW